MMALGGARTAAAAVAAALHGGTARWMGPHFARGRPWAGSALVHRAPWRGISLRRTVPPLSAGTGAPTPLTRDEELRAQSIVRSFAELPEDSAQLMSSTKRKPGPVVEVENLLRRAKPRELAVVVAALQHMSQSGVAYPRRFWRVVLRRIARTSSDASELFHAVRVAEANDPRFYSGLATWMYECMSMFHRLRDGPGALALLNWAVRTHGFEPPPRVLMSVLESYARAGKPEPLRRAAQTFRDRGYASEETVETLLHVALLSLFSGKRGCVAQAREHAEAILRPGVQLPMPALTPLPLVIGASRDDDPDTLHWLLDVMEKPGNERFACSGKVVGRMLYAFMALGDVAATKRLLVLYAMHSRGNVTCWVVRPVYEVVRRTASATTQPQVIARRVCSAFRDAGLLGTATAYASLLRVCCEEPSMAELAPAALASLAASSLRMGPDAYATALRAIRTTVREALEQPANSLPTRQAFYALLLEMVVRLGDEAEARLVLDDMYALGAEPTTPTFNLLLALYAQRGDTEGAQRVLKGMMLDHRQPDLETANLLLAMFAARSDVRGSLRVVDLMQRYKIRPDTATIGSLVQLYCGAGTPGGVWLALQLARRHDLRIARRSADLIARAFEGDKEIAAMLAGLRVGKSAPGSGTQAGVAAGGLVRGVAQGLVPPRGVAARPDGGIDQEGAT